MIVLIFPMFLGSGIGSAPGAGSPPLPAQRNYSPDELLVKYRPGVAPSAIRALQLHQGVEKIRTFSSIGAQQVRIPTGASLASALQNFRQSPEVEYAEPNYRRSLLSVKIPDDPFFPNLWGLCNTGQPVNGMLGTAGADIRAEQAWAIATGNSAITVAIIDSGADYRHPDLAGNISRLQWDFVHGSATPMDALGHGTHVAGTIAAVGNNAIGVTGVSWNATIMPLQAGSALGILYVSDIIAAIDYAGANGAKVLNMSFGGKDFSQAEHDAIQAARDGGILVVAAAGNDGVNNDVTSFYPCGYNLDNIIAVAATDQNDNLCPWSNYGPTTVHVAAPGQNIYSTKPSRVTLWSDSFSYGIGSWITGGSGNTWGISSSQHYSDGDSHSLALNPAGNYQNNADTWARTPAINLSSSIGTKLDFYLKGRSQPSVDLLYVEVSTDGTNWNSQNIGMGGVVYDSGISGDASVQWYDATVDLGSYDGANPVYVRFHFTSDSSVTDIGWYIDDVNVSASLSSYTGTEYQYMSGTSMATPHVAGLGALIWGYMPSLSYAQVKDVILNSVDLESPLAGKMITGGRVNALKALQLMTAPTAPISLSANAVDAGRIDLAWTRGPTWARGFNIERRPGASGAYSRVAVAGPYATTYSDTGLSAATNYVYRIQAYNYAGNSPYTNQAWASTLSAGATAGGAGGTGGGCFIATAAFGSPLESHVLILRQFRDRVLLQCEPGRMFVRFYYRHSPPVAAAIENSAILRIVSRFCLIPAVCLAYLCLSCKISTICIVAALLAISILFIVVGYRSRTVSGEIS